MAKGKAVGSLRWDLVANADGLVSGLRKGQQAVQRAERQMKRSKLGEQFGGFGRRAGFRVGGRGGARVGGAIGRGLGGGITALRGLVPAAGLVSAAFSAAAIAARELAEANSELYLQTTNITRGRNMSFRQGVALQRAQNDPFSRGLGFAMQGRGLGGPEQAQAAVRMLESQRKLRGAIDEMKNAWVGVGTELTEVLNNVAGVLADAGTAAGQGASSAWEWFENWEELLPGGGGLAERRMMERLRNQNLKNQRQGVLASQVGSIPTQTSAAAGSAAEYSFFVRRQRQQEQEVLDLAKDRNLLLRQMNERLGVQRNEQGDIIAITGI